MRNHEKVQGMQQGKKIILLWSLVFCGFFLQAVPAFPAETLTVQSPGAKNWELKRDRDNIQVYTRKVPDSPYAAVRVVSVLENIRLSALVALIRDAPACSQWADKCAESYVYERLSEQEALVYTHNAMPFPVKDRDVLARSSWQQDEVSGVVMMHSVATQDIMPEVKGRLRLTDAEASWIFTPLPSGAVEVVNEAHIDPGSALPGWVTNMLLVDTPFSTMKALTEAVYRPEYRDAIVDFIKDKVPGI
ncbi:MAG: START domain-containing protein [Pseudomonadales bacterium]|nr:START domain-containing protein [Pseudomonadales bacterium]